MSSSNINILSAYQGGDTLAFLGGKAVSASAFYCDVQRITKVILCNEGDVLVCCKSRYAFSVGLVAAWAANRIAILRPDVQSVVGHRSVTSLICDDTWASEQTFGLEETERMNPKLIFPLKQQAVRLYTSGSTGEPKAISKTIENLWAETASLNLVGNWGVGPIVASVPPYHLYGLTFSVLMPWFLGVALVDEMPLHAEEVASCFQYTQAKNFVTVPIHLKALMQSNVQLADKFCIVSAAPLPKETAQQFRQTYGTDALEIYGSSETGIIAYRQQLEQESWATFAQVKISATHQGLLRVASPFVAKDDIEGEGSEYFCTSDQVQIQSDTHFILEGRSDAIIKIAGKRISLARVEQALLMCDNIVDAAVVAVPAESSLRDWAIWAAVVSDAEALRFKDVKKQLSNQLEGVAIPRKMVCVAKLPREDNGKLPKKRLLELFTNV